MVAHATRDVLARKATRNVLAFEATRGDDKRVERGLHRDVLAYKATRNDAAAEATRKVLAHRATQSVIAKGEPSNKQTQRGARHD